MTKWCRQNTLCSIQTIQLQWQHQCFCDAFSQLVHCYAIACQLNNHWNSLNSYIALQIPIKNTALDCTPDIGPNQRLNLEALDTCNMKSTLPLVKHVCGIPMFINAATWTMPPPLPNLYDNQILQATRGSVDRDAYTWCVWHCPASFQGVGCAGASMCGLHQVLL